MHGADLGRNAHDAYALAHDGADMVRDTLAWRAMVLTGWRLVGPGRCCCGQTWSRSSRGPG
eukprot:1902624-Rhodomonas_salina.1